jgi:hypothetical protein
MRGPKPISPIERLMAKVEPCPATGCWLWTGKVSGFGYGRITVQARRQSNNRPQISESTHRFAFSTFVRPLAKGESVLHHCDVPCCVNPAHLYAGTQAQNVRDTINRGRTNVAKLTPEMVAEIRSSTESGMTLAKRLGIAKSTVLTAKRRDSWRNLP